MAEASSNSTSELNTGASIKQPGDGFPTANAVEQETNEASSILATVSSKFDWILFVEGPTDKHFYQKFDFDMLEKAKEKAEDLEKKLDSSTDENYLLDIKEVANGLKEILEKVENQIKHKGLEMSKMGDFSFDTFKKASRYLSKLTTEKLKGKEWEPVKKLVKNELAALKMNLKDTIEKNSNEDGKEDSKCKYDPEEDRKKFTENHNDYIRLFSEANVYNGMKCKKKIYNLLKFKKETCEKIGNTPHFYGITDRDYGEDDENALRKDFLQMRCLMETDAHSLETMLMKYAEKDIGNYLLKVFSNMNPSYCPTLKEAESIYKASQEFALKIGRLRKKNGENGHICNLTRENTDNYFTVISLVGNCTFQFNEDLYIDYFFDVLNPPVDQQSDKHKEIKDIMERKEDEEDFFYICQGHDFVYFINAMFSKIQKLSENTKISTGRLTNCFIDAFKTDDWFKKSSIYERMKEIGQEQLNEIKQKGSNQSKGTEPKYKNIIISVGD